MPQNIYDNPKFFAGYDRLRAENAGMNEALEQPALKSLLPDPADLAGMRVLDIGCGAGEMCRWLADRGAGSVVGMDISEWMLQKAAASSHSPVTYIHIPAEDASFEPASFDLIVSSLTLHYVEDISPLFRNIHTWLSGGGRFVFSMEHPVTTAVQGRIEPRWLEDGTGRRVAWKLGHNSDEGERVSAWFVDGVIKYHRTVATVLNTLIDSGFRIARVLEPHAVEEAERARPELLEERMRPPFLFVAAEASA
ncbi:MAG: class I SAM-dependent methyltransferase [Chloroflexi bacterium]|nr:class I SAM-dependent methyltransferase [Chloroflexota bacterium]